MRILIVSVSDLKNDPRVYRQISHLSATHEVSCVGLGDPLIDGVTFHAIPPSSPWPTRLKTGISMAFRRYESLAETFPALQQLRPRISREPFDLVIANDTSALSFAFAVAGDAPVLFDAHEYAPREFELSRRWRLLSQGYQYYLCRSYLSRCAATTTVCEGLAEEYAREFGVRPDVITNAAPYHDLTPRPTDPDHIRIVHHGLAGEERRIEAMIETMDSVDPRFSLDLMLVKAERGDAYYEHLREMAAGRPNVTIRDPVPMHRIVETIAQYDIGLFLLSPSNFNYYHALPNKLFEFVQARLAIAVGPSPEMARIVRDHDLGIVAPDFEPVTMAERLNALTPERLDHYKAQSHRHARSLSADGNMKKLDEIIGSLADGS
ncbi:MAG TPA: glycosyltransferase family 4 protein [Methanoregulaceae archaeon]|nr:glycosyltransferase family 4 protein [Methanoregulaceae archaeon]